MIFYATFDAGDQACQNEQIPEITFATARQVSSKKKCRLCIRAELHQRHRQ